MTVLRVWLSDQPVREGSLIARRPVHDVKEWHAEQSGQTTNATLVREGLSLRCRDGRAGSD